MADNNELEVIRDTEQTDKEWIVESLEKSGLKSSMRSVELTQDCSFGWTSDVVAEFVKDWDCVDKYYYIVHDKDFKEDCKTPREPHVHLLLKFKSPVPTSAIMARLLKVTKSRTVMPFNHFQKIRTWSGAVNYLTHRDEHKLHKHVYDVSDVFTNADYELDAEQGHDAKQFVKDNARLLQILKGIEREEIREYNITDFVTLTESILYKTQIADAFKYIKAIKKKGEREMEVMFVSGESGVGKDTFARDWCKNRGLSYYCTNNNDDYPFDDYCGEDVIIWSDARDTVFKPRALHQLLDNHYSSKQKARYGDKYIDAKYLIITSIEPLSEWYTEFYKKENEDKTQLYRRIGTCVNMTLEKVTFEVWDFDMKAYRAVPGWLPNTYAHLDERKLDDKQALDKVKSMLGGLAQMMQFTADNIDNPSLKKPKEEEFMDAPENMAEELGFE